MNIIAFLRHYRIGQFAIFDIVVSFVGIYLLSPLIIKFFNYFKIKIGVSNLMWLTIPLSIVFHIIFRTYTPLTKMFLDLHGFYLVKIVILLMAYMGLRGIAF